MSGKSRLVKYYHLARYLETETYKNWGRKFDFLDPTRVFLHVFLVQIHLHEIGFLLVQASPAVSSRDPWTWAPEAGGVVWLWDWNCTKSRYFGYLGRHGKQVYGMSRWEFPVKNGHKIWICVGYLLLPPSGLEFQWPTYNKKRQLGNFRRFGCFFCSPSPGRVSSWSTCVVSPCFHTQLKDVNALAMEKRLKTFDLYPKRFHIFEYFWPQLEGTKKHLQQKKSGEDQHTMKSSMVWLVHRNGRISRCLRGWNYLEDQPS